MFYKIHINKNLNNDRQRELPVIYYMYYTPVSSSISEVAAQEHALGRQLLRTGLAEEFHIQYGEEELEASMIYSLRGKPALRDYPQVQFNITHCSGLAACAFSYDKPIGVDAELPGYFVDILIKRALTLSEKEILRAHSDTQSLSKWEKDLPDSHHRMAAPDTILNRNADNNTSVSATDESLEGNRESSDQHRESLKQERQEWFYRFWTLKEAYVKRSGVGLDTDLTAFSFSITENQNRADNPALVLCSDQSVACYQARLSHGQILSACY